MRWSHIPFSRHSMSRRWKHRPWRYVSRICQQKGTKREFIQHVRTLEDWRLDRKWRTAAECFQVPMGSKWDIWGWELIYIAISQIRMLQRVVGPINWNCDCESKKCDWDKNLQPALEWRKKMSGNPFCVQQALKMTQLNKQRVRKQDLPFSWHFHRQSCLENTLSFQNSTRSNQPGVRGMHESIPRYVNPQVNNGI